MKYRHAHHAGNFADVHKHVTLLGLLAALKRKDKGFLYLETHAGRGVYDLSESAAEAEAGIRRLAGAECAAEQLRHYLARVAQLRRQRGSERLYPGSPWLAAGELRTQDRAVLIECLPAQARALERSLAEFSGQRRIRIDTGDGFERLRAALPPPERRGLVFIDPPYEESRRDLERAQEACADALRRFPTAVVAIWYPIKDEPAGGGWQARLARDVGRQMLLGELWLYPRDSRAALNGSGMLIVNPPYRMEENMESWLAQLHRHLDAGHGGGTLIRRVAPG
jgi:23S rRNA (adenine2030-N6)-methyltransferase